MTVPPQEKDILFRPLFEFVLGGEFEYTKDGERQIHTLGKIAYDACLNGAMTINEDDVHKFPEFTHKLSWEPSIGFVVGGDFDGQTGQSIVKCVSLTHESGLTLDVCDTGNRDPHEQQGITLVKSPHENPIPISFGLNKSLLTAKVALTANVQNYFATIGRM